MNKSQINSFFSKIILSPFVFILLICSSDNLRAYAGSTYKCKMVENLGISDSNLSKLEKYELQEFSFKREKEKLTFGKADNYFQGAEYEITKSFEKMFLARSDQGQIAYNVQNFYYTLTSYANVILITAKCKIQ